MSLKDWLSLSVGDKITRNDKVFEVEAVAMRVGAHMAIKAGGCLQTDYKEWFRFEEGKSQEEVNKVECQVKG